MGALLGSLLGANGDKYAGAVMGTEDIMKPKAHGTSATPVQKDLRWNCDAQTADRICNFNRHYAEFAGYWEQTSFLKEESELPARSPSTTRIPVMSSSPRPKGEASSSSSRSRASTA